MATAPAVKPREHYGGRCHLCFRMVRTLEQHHRTVHTPSTLLYRCPECFTMKRSFGEMDKHYKLDHYGKTITLCKYFLLNNYFFLYTCARDGCHWSTVDAAELNLHDIVKHLDERPQRPNKLFHLTDDEIALSQRMGRNVADNLNQPYFGDVRYVHPTTNDYDFQGTPDLNRCPKFPQRNPQSDELSDREMTRKNGRSLPYHILYEAEVNRQKHLNAQATIAQLTKDKSQPTKLAIEDVPAPIQTVTYERTGARPRTKSSLVNEKRRAENRSRSAKAAIRFNDLDEVRFIAPNDDRPSRASSRTRQGNSKDPLNLSDDTCDITTHLKDAYECAKEVFGDQLAVPPCSLTELFTKSTEFTEVADVTAIVRNVIREEKQLAMVDEKLLERARVRQKGVTLDHRAEYHLFPPEPSVSTTMTIAKHRAMNASDAPMTVAPTFATIAAGILPEPNSDDYHEHFPPIPTSPMTSSGVVQTSPVIPSELEQSPPQTPSSLVLPHALQKQAVRRRQSPRPRSASADSKLKKKSTKSKESVRARPEPAIYVNPPTPVTRREVLDHIDYLKDGQPRAIGTLIMSSCSLVMGRIGFNRPPEYGLYTIEHETDIHSRIWIYEDQYVMASAIALGALAAELIPPKLPCYVVNLIDSDEQPHVVCAFMVLEKKPTSNRQLIRAQIKGKDTYMSFVKDHGFTPLYESAIPIQAI